MKPIVVALLASLLFLAACGDSGRETATPTPPSDTPAGTPAAQTPTEEPAQETPTPTEPPGGAGGGGDGTVVPITTPFPTPPPVSEDWATYTDHEGRFTFRYPAGWYNLTDWLGMASVASWDQQAWQQRDYPIGAIRVDVTALPIEEGLTERPTEASDVMLDGEAGWQFGYTFDPSLGPARNHVIVADHGGYRFMLIGWFAHENPDETTFLQIVSSFRFVDKPSG